MTKPEWGTKRTCMSCTARFYDLNNKPATCPKCGAVLESLSMSGKSKKTKAEKSRDLLGIDDSILGSGLDFSADSLLDENLIEDEEVIDEGLDDIALHDEEEH
ncbi:MAG: FYDLN acid domain-containing protein [Proteobacteria bacterium]|nr:FYDLN acid domain-containing protein [Pseudomonadota bacterium]